MALKNMLKCNGGMYDLWEVRTIEPHEEYDANVGELQYSIVLNREGVTTNANGVFIPFSSKEARDAELLSIEERLREMDIVVVY